jgi:hypothetical protein
VKTPFNPGTGHVYLIVGLILRLSSKYVKNLPAEWGGQKASSPVDTGEGAFSRG